jgi:hypothetical protein
MRKTSKNKKELNMHNKILALFCGATFSMISVYAAVEFNENAPNPTDIQVVPVDRTPEPNDVELRIQYPNYGYLETDSTVNIEMRLDWLPLGVDTDIPRKKELYSNKEGQCLHVFIDDHDYFEINEALFDALDGHDEYFDQISEFKIPFSISPGAHVIRAFPCRSFGESLKSDKASVASVFYYLKKEGTAPDLKKPYLTYNTPQGTYLDEKKPILLDFYINNCTLSKDGFKVRITIDEKNERFLYQWTPYYIYGLGKGKHSIRLELLDPKNKAVPGPFNDVKRIFFIE